MTQHLWTASRRTSDLHPPSRHRRTSQRSRPLLPGLMLGPMFGPMLGLMLGLMLAICGQSTPAHAMESQAFSSLLKQIDAAGLTDSKITLIKTAQSTATFTCAQAGKLLEQIPSSSDRLSVLTLLKTSIEDAQNKQVLLGYFTFDSDKKQAESILSDVKSASARGSTVMPPLQVNQVGAWAAADLSNLLKSIEKENFNDGKLKVLKEAVERSASGFTSDQLRQILVKYSMSSDMVSALRILDSRALGMTSQEVRAVLDTFNFTDDRLTVLAAIKGTITDPENKFGILESFSISSDKEKARKILESVVGRSPLYGSVCCQEVLFVVDTSGSMDARFTTNQGESLTRLQFVARELQNVLKNQQTPSSRFNIIAFSSGVRPWKPAMVTASAANVEEALKYVSSLKADGGTNIYGSLEQAYADKEADAVYFLTDGVPSEGKVQDVKAILQQVTAWNASRAMPIYSIAFLMGTFNGDNKPQSRALMSDLATITKGVYRALE